MTVIASGAFAESPAESLAPQENTSPERIASTAESQAHRVSPFDHLGHNMLWSAFGWPLAFHVAGGGATYFLSTNDYDLRVARFAGRHDGLGFQLGFGSGMLMGTLFPFLVPGYLYFLSDDSDFNDTGAVAIQATAVAFLYNNILKAITGRAHPDVEKNSSERSRDFKWGFLRRGVFYGWPSGHSMTNAGLAMGIASYNRENPWVVAGCSVYAGFVATSMVLGAQGEAHWLSDAVAGTLMGASIGWYIGNTFYQEKRGARNAVSILPVFSEDYQGVMLQMGL